MRRGIITFMALLLISCGPTPTPRPMPSPVAKLDFEVTKANCVWLTTLGTVWGHAAAEITNLGNQAVDLGSVVFTLYGADGKVVDVMTGYPVPRIVRPGEVAYVSSDASLRVKATSEVADLKVNFEYRITDKEPQLLSVENLSEPQEEFLGYFVTGEVVNTSGKAANHIEVAVSFCDADDNFLGVLRAYPRPTLAPGDRMGFKAGTLLGLPPALGARVAKFVGVAHNAPW